MSQPAFAAVSPLPFELVLDDGEPVETDWHVMEHGLLREVIRRVMAEQGRTDFHIGTNNFVYYDVEQAREVYEEETKRKPKRAFRGPDVYWVGGVDPSREREVWIAWEEGGKLPDVIFELLSPSTAKKDRTEKKDLYARVFRTAEYFLYEMETGKLEGLRLAGSAYRPIRPDRRGRFWSEQLGASIGLWRGPWGGRTADWIRLFRADGSLVPTAEERAEAEHLKVLAERQRAEAAEAELARLRALLAERSGS